MASKSAVISALDDAARAEILPRLKTISGARKAARGCRACPLWKNATQTVFGAGPDKARVMLVGEQPGDQEDLAGSPFVGPAGKMLRQALADAEIDPDEVYITNAVKHFKFEQRGKRRIHQKPGATEVRACYPWLKRERELIKPVAVVLLGATAVVSVLGKAMPIVKNRGKAIALGDGGNAFVTVHPSYLLRIPDRADKEKAYTDFVEDLRKVRVHLRAG